MVFLYCLLLSLSWFSLLGSSLGVWSSIFLLASFLIKLPVFLLHGWLPKVHTERPTRGSVVLAALLLKLGVYGLYVAQVVFLGCGSFLVYVSLTGLVVCSVVCCFQRDSKALVAYSSVVHMAILLLFFCGLSVQGS